jgi:hypothetical protein
MCRLRMHGLIERIPGTFRYQVTDAGITRALFLTRLHDKFLRTGLAEPHGKDRCQPPTARPSTNLPAKPDSPPDHASRQAG